MEVSVWQMDEVKVHTIPVLKDNLTYLVSWGEDAIVIDPGEAKPVLDYLEEQSLKLKAILNTHHHDDHTGGNKELLEQTGCRLIAPSDTEIENVDQVVSDDEEIIIGPLLIQVMATPGHTLDHICYYIPDYALLFSGDLIFACGCGKVCEGSFETLFNSLAKVKALPPSTQIFCGHDYCQNNLKFGHSVEPSNEAINQRIATSDFALPTSLDKELATNVFLRTNSAEIAQHLKMEGASELDIFCKLREMKDHA